MQRRLQAHHVSSTVNISSFGQKYGTAYMHNSNITAAEKLSGLKVLDLSRVLAGPLCTMMLGDLGANIIKVERPGSGDDTRTWGPPFDQKGRSAYFLSANRNKLSIAADLKNPADLEVITSLARSADVVVDNFLPGALKRNGLDLEAIMADNQKLIWCSISGFGPQSQRPGYDFVAQAESGWMAITGESHGEPMKVGVALVDVLTGKDAVIGILAALTARDRASLSGNSLSVLERTVHVTLASTALAALVNVAQNVMVSTKPAARWGNAHPNLVPYQLFYASDRPFVLAVGNDGQWQKAMCAIGLNDLAEDTQLASNAGRLNNRERVVEAISDHLKTGTAKEWIMKLEDVGVPCGLVRQVDEALQDSLSSAQTGVEPVLNGRVRFQPPLLDEHGVTIRERGWSLFDIVPILK